MMIPNEAKCKVNIIHNFSHKVEKYDAYIEYCSYCGKKLIIKKYKYRIDNERYYNYHIRDFLQPFGSMRELFEKIYGNGSIQQMKEISRIQNKSLKDKWNEVKDTIKEEGKFSKKVYFT